MQTITASELKQSMEQRDTPVINVLPEEHFDKQHIPGSKNIPVGGDDFVDKVKDLVEDTSQPVVVYCADTDCDASPKAAKKLEDAGFTSVYDFEAGTHGWKDAGFELSGKIASAGL